MTIAVDMSSYIKGGSNGGIVPLTLAAIEGLAGNGNEILILTTPANHEDLAFLERDFVSRFCVSEDILSGRARQEAPQDTAAAPIAIAGESRRRILYLKIRNAIAGAAPEFLFQWCRRHRNGLGKIKKMIFHPVREILRPLAKQLRPHGRVPKPGDPVPPVGTVPAAPAPKRMVYRIDFEKLTGKRVDVMYCPFTAVNYCDPKVAAVSQVNDIQHRYCPWFFDAGELAARDAFYESLVRLSPKIIAISEYTRKTFIETYGYDQEKIDVVYPAVQDRLNPFLGEAVEPYLQKLGLGGTPFILYPANFWPHKNHRGLLTAFSMYVKHNPEDNVKLVLTGFPIGGSEWTEAVRRMELSHRVVFLGYVETGVLAALLRSCRYLIFPSLFEGFGIPLTEAMSVGTGILCSNVTSLPEVAEDCAFYFDPYAPMDICRTMEYVHEHPEELERKKAGYLKQMKKFELPAYVSELERVFTAAKEEMR